MRRFLLLAAFLSLAGPAFAQQQPSPAYTVTVESPGAVLLGDATLRVRVSGGVRAAEGAAYHLRSAGAWSEAQSVRMTRISEEVFEDRVRTADLVNDAYRIEVRVWSDVPPYDSTDPRTYARTIVDVAIDNPPQTPTGVQALTPATALRVGWQAVETSDRSDFAGYRVFVRKEKTCPSDLAAYRVAGDVDTLLYADEKLGPGDYCVRVAALRTSALTDVVLSSPSSPVKVRIARGNDPIVKGGSIVFETTEPKTPPPPPPLGEGETVTSDGEFIEDLPYGPQTVTQEADGVAQGQEISREAGVDPRRGPTLIAIGLILATAAAQVGRFLRAVPKSG